MRGSDEHPVKRTSKHTLKIRVWGAFSAQGTFPLKTFRKNLTGLGYIRILNECLKKSRNYVGSFCLQFSVVDPL